MKSSPAFRYAALIALSYLFASVLASRIPLLDLAETVEAQTGCPLLDAGVKGWPKGTTIYYNISSFPPDIQTKLQQAFQKWSTANGSNDSGVTFASADANHPPAFTVQAGAYQKNGVYSAAGTNVATTNRVVTAATTYIDIFNFGANFFDPGRSDFLSSMLKVMLHEIGHTMGLTAVFI